MKTQLVSLIGFISVLFVQNLSAQSKNSNPVELGTVNWLRSYELAIQESQKQNKPIFVLFQEVPGCSTCQNYGQKVLGDPIIVDAIENEFIPLCIYNNVSGEDRKILKKYKEPTWNNPVVRIINKDGEDIISRHARDYSADGLIRQMSLALGIEGSGPPTYLNLYLEELEAKAKKTETCYYQMYCFWSGEAHLGNQKGVIATEPGFMNKAEVVKVIYDPHQIDKNKLDEHASKAKCTAVNKISKYRIDKDPQYYLKKSAYKYLALSDIQKTKINAALKNGDPGIKYLSPTQVYHYTKTTKKNPTLYLKPLREAWNQMD